MKWKALFDAAPSVALPLGTAVVLLLTGCAGTGNCVQVYEFEGTVVKEGYTRSECEDECAIIGRTLQCFFEPRVEMPLGVGGRVDFNLPQ